MMSQKYHRSTDNASWGVEKEIESYRTICVSAFCGLGLGLLSLLAFAYSLMWVLPVAGVLVSVIALRRIAREPDRLVGRRAALIGLAVSVLIGIGVPTQALTHRWVVLYQSERFAGEWFTHLRDGNPHMALELTREIKKRRPMGEGLWQVYRNNPSDAEALRKYIRDPLVAALLVLGDSATVRHYQTVSFVPIDVGDAIEEMFAVTYEEDGQQKTFFVNVSVGRDFEPYKGVIPMRIFHAEGGIVPEQFETERQGLFN
jgi:hypothetical protein